MLAEERKCLPDTFRFDVYLKLAAKMLDHTFTEDDAKKRYTIEAEMLSSPSLRRHARHIYGFSYFKKDVGRLIDLGYDEPNQEFKDLVNAMIDENDYGNSREELFDKIGGKDIWVQFMSELVLNAFLTDYDKPEVVVDWTHYAPTEEQIKETKGECFSGFYRLDLVK